MDELDKIVDEAERKYGVFFCEDEIRQFVADVVAKCERIGKGEEYLPVLFQCELKNKIFADMINSAGLANMLAKKGGACVE